jgi:hypothetical protein
MVCGCSVVQQVCHRDAKERALEAECNMLHSASGWFFHPFCRGRAAAPAQTDAGVLAISFLAFMMSL